MLRRAVLAVSAVVVLATPAVASATPTFSSAPTSAAPQTQGIIMSDGRICNPRWGC